MNPMMLASLMQMSQGFGSALGTGGSEAWGNALSPSILGGYLKGRGQKKAKKKAQKRFNRALNLTESVQGANLQQQEALSRQATQQQLGGYDTARKETARLGRGAKRSALDRETQFMGRASQNMANRGLGSTTIGANLQRGIASDTNRSMADVDEGMAGLFGNLALGRSGVEAQGTANLAGIADQRAGLATQLGQMRLLGGATLGSLGSFDPGSWNRGYMQDNSEAFGGFMGSLGGMGGKSGGGGMPFDPQEFMMYLYDMQQNGLGHTPMGGQ